MAHEIRYKASVERELGKLPKDAARRVLDAIHVKLGNDPRAGRPLKGGLRGLYRLRVGDYRVVYSFLADEEAVLVLKIADRKDAYR